MRPDMVAKELARLPKKLEPYRLPLRRIVAAARHAFGANLRAVIVKGSVLKSDFIPGYSDLDIHIFLAPKALIPREAFPSAPTLEQAYEFQTAIGDLDPGAYNVSQFQITFLSAEDNPRDWAPPPKGSYVLIWGRPPPALKEPGPTEYRKTAHSLLTHVPSDIAHLLAMFVDKPDGELARVVRFQGAVVKSAVYTLLSLLEEDPRTVWFLSFDEVAAHISQKTIGRVNIDTYLFRLKAWEEMAANPKELRKTFRLGIKCLEAVYTIFERAEETGIAGRL